MKKLWTILVLILMLSLTALSGCNKNQDDASEQTTETTEQSGQTEENEKMNLEDVFFDGMKFYEDKGMEPPVLFPETDMEVLESIYPGIGYAKISQFYIALAPDADTPMEVALIEVADGTDVPAIRDILNERIDAKANDSEHPEEAEVWKNNGRVTILGNYIFMAVMPDEYGIPEEFILPD